LEDWVELPDVTPEQMKSARLFKYYFSGELYSEVTNSFNYFPGYEIHLLKCQILRILHGSFIVPSGFLKPKSEVEEGMEGKLVELDSDFVIPAIEDLNGQDKWVHEFANILLAGRIIHQKLENDEAMNDLLEKDKYVDRLQVIQNDERIFPNLLSLWRKQT
jgi:hypothetical protein